MVERAKREEAGERIRVYGNPSPAWVTCVPSLRHPELVPSFARRLAVRLRLPFTNAVRKVRDTPPQKEQENSHYQLQNLDRVFEVTIPGEYRGHPVLLVDDMVDSRWTLTVLAGLLREHGASLVYPLALAETTGKTEE